MDSLATALLDLDVDGCAVHHLDRGAPLGEDASPVVLLHGLGASYRYFQANIGPLSEQHRVLALDLPGFGRSGKPDAPYSIGWFVDKVARFLDGKGVARAHLVGNSLGGQIALGFALAHPERVDRLVLAAPAGITNYPPLLDELLAVLERAAHFVPGQLRPQRRVPSSVVRVMLRAIFPSRADLATLYARAYLQTLASDEYPLHLRAVLRALRGSAALPLRHAASEVQAPTLIVWGDHDRVLPVAGARALRKRIAAAEMLIYKDSGHCPMIDAAPRFNREVLRFLAGEPVGV